ncbi:MAG: endonuclease/exonuclease/phosphatase family protein [Planctomycetia bacterium]|nr:endonuclease/exonuclease/phosphatase family protein [Planctomycetia bacterium]
MKKCGSVFLIFWLAGGFLWGEEFSSIRILTYNVHNTRGMDHPAMDVPRIARIVRETACTVAALQELDCRTERSQGRDLLAELAEETELVPTFGKAIDFQGGGYGVGILSREKPRQVREIPLPGREEKRMALLAEYEEFFFCSTHWSLNAEDRFQSAEILCRELENLSKPVLLAGDLNAEPNSKEINRLRQIGICVSPLEGTWPADIPQKTIDYIWVFLPEGTLLHVVKSQILNEPAASDHRPVLVEIELKSLAMPSP